MDIEKIEKNNFLLQNDQFFTKGVEIFRKCIVVILKGLHQQKLKKSFRYKMIRKSHCYKFIIYLTFKESILKNYEINSYTLKSLQDIQ